MAEIAGNPHKLDEISATLGELRAYMHEHRHGVANLGMKFDGLVVDLTRRMEALDTKMTVRIDEIHRGLASDLASATARIALLEKAEAKRDGATGLFTWVFANWPSVVGMVGVCLLVLKVNGKLP